MSVGFVFATFAYAGIIGLITNSFLWVYENPQSLFWIVPLFLFINFFAGFLFIRSHSKRLRVCYHGDVVDLNRQNIKGFDVREFYVQLVKDLKDRGL